MNRLQLFVLLLFLSLSLSVSFSFAKSQIPNPQSATVPHPFFFTENRGQWDSHVLYKCNARNGMTWFLERDGITLLTMKEDRTKALIIDSMDRDLPDMLRRHPARYPMKSHALKFKFLATSNVGAQLIAPAVGDRPPIEDRHVTTDAQGCALRSSRISVETSGELPWCNNYFLGNDSTKWAPNCRNYTNIAYREVWDGIDIEWYEENGKLEFDFVVQPGADPSQIRMSCEGLEGDLSVSPSTIHQSPYTGAELRLPTSLGELRTALPQVYQISPGGSRSEVDANFKLIGKNEFGITLPNGYQKEHTLRIDPLVYSTYLGGSSQDEGFSIAVDGNENILVTGITYSTNFPTTVGAGDTTANGDVDCFITKMDSTLSQILFGTYLGGSSGDYVCNLAIDNNGGVFVTGYTFSSNFPHYALLGVGGTGNCFVSHINILGSQLLFSTLLGGSSDQEGDGIACDGSSGVFVAGSTTSSNFPVTASAYDVTYNSTDQSTDGIVFHLDSTGTNLIYSTFLGGSHGDGCIDVVTDDSGGIIVAGSTFSSDFPTTPGAFDRTFHVAFITHLNHTGSQLVYSTFLGGNGNDGIWKIAKSETGGILITGLTNSTDFPTTTGCFDSTYNGGMYDCFISYLNDSGSQLISSSYLGGSDDDVARSIVYDGSGGCFVAGYTPSDNFPTTPNAYCTSYNGGMDGFLAHLNFNNSQLLYCTYFGSTGADFAEALTTSANGCVVIAGNTTSPHFPVTSSSYDTSFQGGRDCFISVLRLVPDTNDVTRIKVQFPSAYSLNQNYPNPFNSSTTISYSLPKPGTAKLELFDLLGRRISTLVNSSQGAGVHHVRFDGKNLASGEYFYRLSAGNFQQTKKLLLLK